MCVCVRAFECTVNRKLNLRFELLSNKRSKFHFGFFYYLGRTGKVLFIFPRIVVVVVAVGNDGV